MTKEDLQQISQIIGEQLNPIKEDIDSLKGDIKELKADVNQIKEDIRILKEDLEEVRVTTNSTSEWAEALTEYHFPDIHYPLHDDEKIS